MVGLCEVGLECGVKELLERLGMVGLDVLVVDPDVGEEALVEEPFFLGVGAGVGVVGVGEHVDCSLEGAGDVSGGRGGFGQSVFDGSELLVIRCCSALMRSSGMASA